MLALSLGVLACVSTPAPESEAAPRELAELPAPEPEPPPSQPGDRLGSFRLTYYWLAHEQDHPPGEDFVRVQTCAQAPLAKVPASFAQALRLEGSGKLLDGRVLNIGACACKGAYACFAELDADAYPWGQGSRGNALEPYRSVATDPSRIAFGTMLYAPALDGVTLPSGRTHDGCLRAADVGGGIEGAHIDWFVGLRSNYRGLVGEVPERVELYTGGERCPPPGS